MTSAGLLALLAVSALWRTSVLHAFYWIDEGLSVGISSHQLSAIPGVLRQDGSPPLYYALLHVWMSVFGRGEQATHVLSLVFALLTIPVALWAGHSLFGRRAGWLCAGLAALDPFISIYSQETRMYALVVLLSLISFAAFLHVFAFGRRRYAPLLAIALAALLYTHNWGGFLALGMGLTAIAVVLLHRHRRALVDLLLAFGGAIALFAPWLPTLRAQAAHTGAPWSLAPTWRAAQQIPYAILGGLEPTIIVLLAGVTGLVFVLRRKTTPAPLMTDRRRAVAMGVVALALTVAVAWVFAKAFPGWAERYFAVFVGPLVLILGAALARLRWLGIVVLVALALIWLPSGPALKPIFKSNVGPVAHLVNPVIRPGDLVVATQPEELPVLTYYLKGSGLRWATTLGSVADPTYMDWRDALSRLRAAKPGPILEPLLAGLPRGSRIVLIVPLFIHSAQWIAPWTALVKIRSLQWEQALAADARFRRAFATPRHGKSIKSAVAVRAIVYTKTA